MIDGKEYILEGTPITIVVGPKRTYIKNEAEAHVLALDTDKLEGHMFRKTTDEWYLPEDLPRGIPEGSYLVVVEGHGTRYMKVDHYDADDHQWKSEYDDPAVRVTHISTLR